ncbi:IclR family transcriptional regulator [Flavobacterium sp. JP2137]|uniref:IclR family transcriptional regulator n=1 Tax=Flavobacterium sp. JP2137 TaxID=3414510 RepID=UPI003D2FAA7B
MCNKVYLYNTNELMIESVKRTLEIMQYIAQNGNQVRLKDVAEHLQIGKSTAHHFLKSLLELGYLEQDELSPRYSLSDKVQLLIPPQVSPYLLKQRFRPLLQKIMELTGETTYLTLQMGAHIRHELKCEPERNVRISLELGKEFTVMNSAIGNVFLAYSEHLRQHVLRSLSTEEAKQLNRRLDTVISQGYASDFERLEKELNCIAVPVFDQKRLIAAIGVSGPAYRFQTAEMMKAVKLIQSYL